MSEPKLKRELGLRDVTLFATTCIVATRWIPAAAHAGPGSVALWVLTAVLFMVPLAVAVGALAGRYPGPGGLYTWTRNDFGPWHGFLAFFVFWVAIAVWFPSASIFYMSAGLAALPAPVAALAGNRAAMLAVAIAAIWIALGSNMIGVKFGKWTENIGGGATWVVTLFLLGIAILVWRSRGSATAMDVVPKWNWSTVNFWSNLAYGMSGMETVALMGAEIRNPLRTLPRAGWIASAFAAVFYTSATVALLVILPPDQINEVTGFREAGHAAAAVLQAGWIAPVLSLLVLATGLGQIGGLGTGVSRLPFAAGVDRMLPPAFARVHPRWGTPHISILWLGFVATFLIVIYQLGDTMRAAYDELVSLMVITGFLPYLYIFGSAWKAGRRISALSGWLVTLLTIVCAVVPTPDVANVWLFEAKLLGGAASVIFAAWLLHRRAGRA